MKTNLSECRVCGQESMKGNHNVRNGYCKKHFPQLGGRAKKNYRKQLNMNLVNLGA